MSIEVDISAFKEYQKLLESKIKGMDAFMKECADELRARLLAKVIKRTPVGQHKGIVRFVTSDGKEISFKVTPKAGGTLRDGWRSLHAIKTGDEYIASVFNPVEYATYVEYGHRKVNRRREAVGWQEGVHMLEESEEDLRAELDSIISQRLQEYLGDLL